MFEKVNRASSAERFTEIRLNHVTVERREYLLNMRLPGLFHRVPILNFELKVYLFGRS